MSKNVMKAIDQATHVYLARKTCGCPVAVCTDIDIPSARKDASAFVLDCIKRGYAVSRVTFDEYRESGFGKKCPHAKGL